MENTRFLLWLNVFKVIFMWTHSLCDLLETRFFSS